MDFKSYIRDIPDFPQKGVLFKDISPLLKDPLALQAAAQALHNLVKHVHIQKVVGIESRGFFFAPLLASKLKAGFVPVRKQGKLPGEKVSISYALEYGKDVLELHADAIQKGDKVLIHDDVLATGGTARAVCDLVEGRGGEVVHCLFLLELLPLEGISKLDKYQVSSLMKY